MRSVYTLCPTATVMLPLLLLLGGRPIRCTPPPRRPRLPHSLPARLKELPAGRRAKSAQEKCARCRSRLTSWLPAPLACRGSSV